MSENNEIMYDYELAILEDKNGRNTWTIEKINELIDLYNRGYGNQNIANKINVNVYTVKSKICKLQQEGVLALRRPKKDVEAELQVAREMWPNLTTITELADALKCSIQVATNRLTELANRGEIPKQFRDIIRDRNKFADSTLEDGQTVRCTKTVSKKCVYGCENPSDYGGKCRYIQCTGHMRGCSWKACDKFSLVSRTNRRRPVLVGNPVKKNEGVN